MSLSMVRVLDVTHGGVSVVLDVGNVRVLNMVANGASGVGRLVMSRNSFVLHNRDIHLVVYRCLVMDGGVVHRCFVMDGGVMHGSLVVHWGGVMHNSGLVVDGGGVVSRLVVNRGSGVLHDHWGLMVGSSNLMHWSVMNLSLVVKDWSF